MAIVVNRADTSIVPDRSYFTHNRTNAGTPNAVLTPVFVGEIMWDTTNKVRWKAIGVTNADWTPMAAEVI